MQWEGLLIQVIYLLIATFVPVLGLTLRKYIMSQAVLADFLAKEELVATGVEFAEQFYKEYGGPDKYKLALMWIGAQFEANGINVSEDELQGLIEAAVYELQSGWSK